MSTTYFYPNSVPQAIYDGYAAACWNCQPRVEPSNVVDTVFTAMANPPV